MHQTSSRMSHTRLYAGVLGLALCSALSTVASAQSPTYAQLADPVVHPGSMASTLKLPGAATVPDGLAIPGLAPKPNLGQTPTQSRANAMAGSVGQSVAPGSDAGQEAGPTSGLTHPYRMIVRSSTPILRSQVLEQLGDSRVKMYALSYGTVEVREYVLTVETTLPKEDVIRRLQKVPGVKLVAEDSLMHTN